MSCTGPLIAVVDDEASVRTMLRRVLWLANYRVSTFASGEAFLGSLVAHPPACAVLDFQMPGLTGLEVQLSLRADKIEIPVIFITASDDVALDQAVCDAGGLCLLRKPFASDDLLDAVRLALLQH